jgi:hypothetical protein
MTRNASARVDPGAAVLPWAGELITDPGQLDAMAQAERAWRTRTPSPGSRPGGGGGGAGESGRTDRHRTDLASERAPAGRVSRPAASEAIEMVTTPEYNEAHKHRESGLERTVVVACAPVVDRIGAR